MVPGWTSKQVNAKNNYIEASPRKSRKTELQITILITEELRSLPDELKYKCQSDDEAGPVLAFQVLTLQSLQ